MSWIDVVDENQFLKSLYPTSPPELDGVRVHEVKLHQDGPTVSLRFDLHEYPVDPPAKWQAAGSNTAQVRLVGVGVQVFSLRGWASNNIGRLAINRGGHAIIVEFDSGDCRMSAAFDHVRVEGVAAYLDESRAPR